MGKNSLMDVFGPIPTGSECYTRRFSLVSSLAFYFGPFASPKRGQDFSTKAKPFQLHLCPNSHFVDPVLLGRMPHIQSAEVSATQAPFLGLGSFLFFFFFFNYLRKISFLEDHFGFPLFWLLLPTFQCLLDSAVLSLDAPQN